MKIEIFGKEIQNEMDFHKQFNKYADYPYYGHNLNALWDVLTGMLERPAHLIWHDSKLSKEASVGWALAAHHLVSLCFYKNNPSENQNLQTAFSNLLSAWA